MQINFKLLNEAVDISDSLEILYVDPNHDRDTPENSRIANKSFRGTAIENLMAKYGYEPPKSFTPDDIARHKSNNLIAFHNGKPIAHCWLSEYLYLTTQQNLVPSGPGWIAFAK